ncbi:MAG: hypothetical protein ABL997_00500 [Planctomycetota bacterium]
MIGFLLALVLVVGGPSLVRADNGVPCAVAICVERLAPGRVECALGSAGEARVEALPRRSEPRCVPRWLDRKGGGLPPSRAPDCAPTPSPFG